MWATYEKQKPERNTDMIKTFTLNEASKYLRDRGLKMWPGTLADGLEQGVYPFGVCIRTGRSRVFQIFKRKLDLWIEEVDDD